MTTTGTIRDGTPLPGTALVSGAVVNRSGVYAVAVGVPAGTADRYLKCE
jgi:hypothetical protein